MAATVARPFRRGRFDGLPEQPRRSHSYFESPARELHLTSAPYGTMNVHYRALGSGPPLLLVHGLMTTSYSWRYVLDELARDYRVIAPDLPGCGRSDEPVASYAGDALAAFVLEFQRALGVRGCPIVGHSMGGYLAMKAAMADERAFARVVNIHSPGVSDLRYRALHAVLALRREPQVARGGRRVR